MADSTELTHAIIKNASGAVDTYIGTANSLYSQLTDQINTLTGSSFIGDGSDGYKAFFTEKIVPALTDNLTAGDSSLTASIKSILESIETTILDTVDPKIGESNRNAGSNAES
ncbi:MAG: hypothetical protein U0L49_00310 [Eubacterium sp.]|nr:hypothetical protein [Eubacterium sp.]